LYFYRLNWIYRSISINMVCHKADGKMSTVLNIGRGPSSSSKIQIFTVSIFMIPSMPPQKNNPKTWKFAPFKYFPLYVPAAEPIVVAMYVVRV